MDNKYGNFFSDVTLTINHRYLKKQVKSGCELVNVKLNKLMYLT
ncbi:MAG: hypothetical protein RR942_13865 [Romboutsia sp.]